MPSGKAKALPFGILYWIIRRRVRSLRDTLQLDRHGPSFATRVEVLDRDAERITSSAVICSFREGSPLVHEPQGLAQPESRSSPASRRLHSFCRYAVE